MRRFRVGTLSMGVVLIALGIALIVGQFNSIATIDTLIKWWPIILFLLGGEILWYVYRAKEQEARVKYDVFSIFMIFIIICSSTVVYAVTEIGIIPEMTKMVSAKEYTLKTPYYECDIDNSIKKIVVESISKDLTFRSYDGNKVIVSGNARVSTDSKKTAESIIGEYKVNYKKIGDTLYIYFDDIHSNNGFNYYSRILNYSIAVPQDINVEIKKGDTVEIIGNIKNNWIIDDVYRTYIRLDKNSDVKIQASVNDDTDLHGNIEWNTDTQKKAYEEEEYQRDKVTGEYLQGEGKYKCCILESERVTVNTVE